MCLKTICEASFTGSSDPFTTAHEIWSRLSDAWDAAYHAQEEARQWNEAITDELGAMTEVAFEKALKTVPLTLPSLALYISMLAKRGVAESPESIKVALVTIRHTLEALIAAQTERDTPSQSERT